MGLRRYTKGNLVLLKWIPISLFQQSVGRLLFTKSLIHFYVYFIQMNEQQDRMKML